MLTIGEDRKTTTKPACGQCLSRAGCPLEAPRPVAPLRHFLLTMPAAVIAFRRRERDRDRDRDRDTRKGTQG